MSKPKIVRFDFGSSTGTSELQNKNKKEKEPDNLFLVDAFWVKDGMKIRFIPHQLEGITLIVVFALEHDDETHDREKAVFDLELEIPDTRYEDASTKTVTVSYSEIKNNKFSKHRIDRIFDERGYDCYYYEYKIDKVW
jgi:hypothetical protein